MIEINILTSLVVGIGIIIYYYIFPKKKPKPLYLLILISLLPLISILRRGTYESGDLSFHIKLAMQFFENLQQGILIPEWIPRHCSGYGCPIFIYMFFLPYYVVSFFHVIGFSFIASMKSLIALSFISSGVGMFLWIKKELGEKAGFTAAIFYLYAPYHLMDMHFRVDIGELLSIALLPFIFLFTKLFMETSRPIYFISNAVVLALLILSHQVTAYVTFPLAILYIIFILKRNKKIKLSIILFTLTSFLFGLLLSSFYWIPILFEKQYILYNADNIIQFIPVSYFFYTPGRFGLLYQGHHGELYYSIGYTEWFVIILSIYLLLKKKIHGITKTFLIINLLLFTVFFFMMLSISNPLWQHLPLLKSFQFSWRLLIEEIFFISIIAGILVKTINQNTFTLFLCSITVLYTILNWGNRTMLPNVTDKTLNNELVFKEYPGQVDITTPKWVDQYKPWIGTVPENHIDILSGQAKIKELERITTKHKYIISTKTNVSLKENTYYYPGWEVFINNQQVPINYRDKKYPGVIMFNLKKGLYYIDIVFRDTPDRLISKWVSGITAIFLLLYTIYLLTMSNLPKRLRLSPKR